MPTYHQLSLEERCSIARLREAGQSIRQIAAVLDRAPSSISRELKRNVGAKVGYRPAYAQAQANARRWTGARLAREDDLRETILDRLAQGWSPEQVAGRLARETGRKVISHETIYRFVHAQLKRTNDRLWRFYLPRAKYKRGWRTKGGWPRYAGRPSIHDRPDSIATRQQAGHWEADAMLFSRPGQAILVAHERHSRLTIALQQDSLKADPVAAASCECWRQCPPPCGAQSRSTMEQSLTGTSRSPANSALIPSSAIPDPPGRKGASKTQSADCDETCPEKPTSINCSSSRSMTSSLYTITRRENASASKHPPKPSSTRCTSNVNPHPGQAGVTELRRL